MCWHMQCFMRLHSWRSTGRTVHLSLFLISLFFIWKYVGVWQPFRSGILFPQSARLEPRGMFFFRGREMKSWQRRVAFGWKILPLNAIHREPQKNGWLLWPHFGKSNTFKFRKNTTSLTKNVFFTSRLEKIIGFDGSYSLWPYAMALALFQYAGALGK